MSKAKPKSKAAKVSIAKSRKRRAADAELDEDVEQSASEASEASGADASASGSETEPIASESSGKEEEEEEEEEEDSKDENEKEDEDEDEDMSDDDDGEEEEEEVIEGEMSEDELFKLQSKLKKKCDKVFGHPGFGEGYKTRSGRVVKKPRSLYEPDPVVEDLNASELKEAIEVVAEIEENPDYSQSDDEGAGPEIEVTPAQAKKLKQALKGFTTEIEELSSDPDYEEEEEEEERKVEIKDGEEIKTDTDVTAGSSSSSGSGSSDSDESSEDEKEDPAELKAEVEDLVKSTQLFLKGKKEQMWDIDEQADKEADEKEKDFIQEAGIGQREDSPIGLAGLAGVNSPSSSSSSSSSASSSSSSVVDSLASQSLPAVSAQPIVVPGPSVIPVDSAIGASVQPGQVLPVSDAISPLVLSESQPVVCPLNIPAVALPVPEVVSEAVQPVVVIQPSCSVPPLPADVPVPAANPV